MLVKKITTANMFEKGQFNFPGFSQCLHALGKIWKVIFPKIEAVAIFFSKK